MSLDEILEAIGDAAQEDREMVAEKALKEYTGDDKDFIKDYVWEFVYSGMTEDA